MGRHLLDTLNPKVKDTSNPMNFERQKRSYVCVFCCVFLVGPGLLEALHRHRCSGLRGGRLRLRTKGCRASWADVTASHGGSLVQAGLELHGAERDSEKMF